MDKLVDLSKRRMSVLKKRFLSLRACDMIDNVEISLSTGAL